MRSKNLSMSETDAFDAMLRCDGCQRLIEVALDARQAEVYVSFLERQDFDAAMDVLRQPGTYPHGWTQQPEIVQRDTLFLDRRTGEATTSSIFVPAFLDFCPECSGKLLN